MQDNNKWQNFLKELSNLLFFWFYSAIFFFVFRLVFITFFHKKITTQFEFSEYFNVFLMGFRFDCTAIAYFLLLPTIALLSLSYFNHFKVIKSIRKIHQFLFVVLSSIICVVTINYFKEYDDQFNNFMFLALYDDQKAVLQTILEYYHPLLNGFILILSILIGLFIFKKFEKKTLIYRTLNSINFKFKKPTFIIVFLLLFVAGIRGSFSSIPVLRQYSGVSKDEFLNKTIINPYRSLKYAISDFNRVNLLNSKNPFLSEKEFNKLYPYSKVTDALHHKAKGAKIEKPKQIFLVVMESYDSWPLMDKYKDFHLADNLKDIASRGTHFYNFLPSGNTTIDSFGAIMTNVPNCGINLSHIGTVNEPFVTSIFSQFKKLGYQTNFYYGGYLSWENIGELSKYQGVDRIFSGVDGGGKTDTGGWGIEDEKLFNLVMKNTDKEKYTFNLILTTSYHAPYSVDLEAKGFPYKSTDDFPAGAKKYFDGSMNIKELGHLWYGDKAIGDFVKISEKKYSNSIFCFTGDHFGRKFINSKPTLYEKSSVAFIMYGKNIPIQKNDNPGSHIDIMPTLFELIAPKDFEYYSFGKSMFDDKDFGLGYQKMISKKELNYFPTDKKPETFIMNASKKSFDKSMKKEHDRIMALAWYYTMKGNNLKKKK